MKHDDGLPTPDWALPHLNRLVRVKLDPWDPHAVAAGRLRDADVWGEVELEQPDGTRTYAWPALEITALRETRPCPICRAPDGFHDDEPHASRGVDPTKLYERRHESTGRTRHGTGEPVTHEVWRRPDGAPLPYRRGRPLEGARPGATVRVWSEPGWGVVGRVVGMETVGGWPNVVAVDVEPDDPAVGAPVRATAWEVTP